MTIKIKKCTFAQMKKNDKAAGHHWFENATLEHWNTKFHTQPDKWNMFVHSTQYMHASNAEYDAPPTFRVAIHIPKLGKTFSVSSTEGFKTLEEATAYRAAIAKAFESAQNRELDIIENMVAVDHFSNQTVSFYRASEDKKFEVLLPERRIIG